ncbi:MAG: hypothetical protein RLZZ127_2595 [Planctomycetota bacterium]|jgi:hypothetical protein
MDANRTSDDTPRMHHCRQAVHRSPLGPEALWSAIGQAIAALRLGERIRPGQEIAIGAGSRGIDNYPLVVSTVVRAVRDAGGIPFIFPAMGSHGGATADGQRELLASLGISEAAMGCPIRSSMDVVTLGRTPQGLPIFLDRHAAGAAGIIVVNRIKPHTNFRGHVESGLMKMLAIGTGKQAQALAIHKLGALALRDHMPDIGRGVIATGKVIGGIGLVEDACHATCEVVGFPGEAIEAGEAEVLARAKSWAPRLPVEDLDLLIVERIGKDVSGTGMDTNVIGRCQLVDFQAFPTPRIQIIVGLSLTEGTHGNGIGMGLCDLVTRRLRDQVDFAPTYVNVITGQCPKNASLPPVMDDDRTAILTALDYLVPGRGRRDATIIRIRDTLHLEEFQVSAALVPLLAGRPGLEIDPTPIPMAFTATGDLV